MKKSARSHFGHVKRLGPGKHRAYWEEPRDAVTGKRNQRSKVIDGSDEDAWNFLAVKRVELLGADRDTTYGVFWDACVEPSLAGLAENTVDEYTRVWNGFLKPVIGGMRISETTPDFAERVLLTASSPSLQRKAMRLWRKVCNRARRERIISYNPIDRYIKLDRVKPKPKRLLEADEIPGWMAAIEGIRYEPALLCEIGGGLSPEEACALDREDIRPYEDGGRLYAMVRVSKALTTVSGRKLLKDTKNNFRVRTMIIGEPFARRILETSAGTGPLLPSGMPPERGRPESAYASPITVTHNWKAWCERHGVPYVTQANMRSSFATLHGEAGSPDSVVSGAMGHSGGSTKAKHYQKITRRALVAIADGLAAYIAERGGYATTCNISADSEGFPEAPTREADEAQKQENRL